MKDMIKEEKPDIAFGMLHYGCMVLSLMKFFLGNKMKIVISPRTPSKDAINFYFRKAPDRMLWKFMVRFFCKYSDYIVVPCEGMKDECIFTYRADKSKISTIRNAIDISLINGLSMEPLRVESPPDNFIISTSARLASEKSLPVLIRAFALLRTYLNAKLWIIGDGPERPYLESLASDLSISSEVVFWGFQTNPYKFIKRSDVFVHTSIFEGFANVIWEAIACRVPVIATDCNYGPREIIKHMEDGMLVPVSNEVALMQALKAMLENGELRRTFIENAYERLLEHSAVDIVNQYEDVFIKTNRKSNFK
jgi:glycosyltransferase involved in cell wall biosynthesis